MATKTSWHRYGTKLRRRHPMYSEKLRVMCSGTQCIRKPIKVAAPVQWFGLACMRVSSSFVTVCWPVNDQVAVSGSRPADLPICISQGQLRQWRSHTSGVRGVRTPCQEFWVWVEFNAPPDTIQVISEAAPVRKMHSFFGIWFCDVPVTVYHCSFNRSGGVICHDVFWLYGRLGRAAEREWTERNATDWRTPCRKFLATPLSPRY